MSLEILSIGTAIPEHSIEQWDAASMGLSICTQSKTHSRVLPELYRRSGVRTRHLVVLDRSTNGTVARQSFYAPASSPDDRGPTTAGRMQLYEDHVMPLGAAAATDALADSDISASEITHLVTVSCSGFSAPGFDIALIGELGLSADVARTHVGFMGCHAALNGLRVMKAFTDADPAARVLLCAVELCSLHQQYGWNPDRIVSNALFADGAAAVVGRRAHDDDESAWRLAASGSTVIPGTTDAMSWRIGDHGFQMTLSPRVPDLIRQHLRPWLGEWLAASGLAIGDIGSWAVHPGGPKVLSATAEAAGFAPSLLEPSRQILADFGNMSSPTVLFIIDKLRRSGAPRPCVSLAFGPGLTIEAALIV